MERPSLHGDADKEAQNTLITGVHRWIKQNLPNSGGVAEVTAGAFRQR